MPKSVSKQKVITASDSDTLSRIENNQSDIICLHAPDGVYRYVAPSVRYILGYSPEELIGTSPYDYFHPDDAERVRNASHDLALKGLTEETRIEYRYRKKDGSYTWLQTQTTPISDAGGSVIELLTVTRDISDRKKDEENILELEASYRQLYYGSPAVWLIVEPQTGRILAANQVAANFYGYTLEEMKAMTIFKINVSSADEIKEFMLKVSGGYCKAIPFRHRLKDGSLRDVEVYSTPVILKGKVLLHSIIIDVTARTRAEADLRESRERLELVAQGAKAGIWDWDMRTNKVFYDKQWKAILGYGEDEIHGDMDMWTSRLHPEDEAKIKTAVKEYLDGKIENYEVAYRLRHKDGSYRWVLSKGKVTRDHEGQPVRWTGFNIDISAYKRTKELYQESVKLLRDFAEAVPDTCFILNEDGYYLEVFGNAELFHIPKADFLGRTPHEILPQEDADFILQEVQSAIASGSQRTGVREIKLGSQTRCFSGRTVPLSYMVDGKRIAAVIAVDITEQQRTYKLLQMTYELRRRSDYINDILTEKPIRDEDMAFISRRIGLDFGSSIIVFKILSDKLDFLEDRNRNKTLVNGSQKLKDELIDALSALPNCIAWDYREGIGVLFQVAGGAMEWKCAKEIAEQIKAKILEIDSGLAPCVGISNMNTGIEGLRKGCRQALRAALAARCGMIEVVDIVHYQEAGILQFLPDSIKGEAAKEYIEQHIGRLIAYDQEKQTNYMETLEDFLRGTSLRETGEKQHLHAKSVVFRHKRIAEMLGVDLSDYRTKLALSLALQLYKLNKL